MNKIQHRKRYIKKQKADASNAKDDELDLLGEGDMDSFTGSNADLESAEDNLFTLLLITAVNLDLPPPRHRTTIQTEDMDVDYGPALPPRLGTDPHNTSDQNVSASEEPSKKVSDRPKNTAILAVDMKLNPGLPRINSMRNLMNLGSHLLNLKNTLIRVNIKPGPDMCHLPQRRISPL